MEVKDKQGVTIIKCCEGLILVHRKDLQGSYITVLLTQLIIFLRVPGFISIEHEKIYIPTFPETEKKEEKWLSVSTAKHL
jgi:hypothetical protein